MDGRGQHMTPYDPDDAQKIDQFVAARRLQTPIWLYDIDQCRIINANDAACTLWQASTEVELQGRDMAPGMSATVAKRLKQYQADFIARDATFNEMWTLFPKGVPTSVMALFRGFRLPDGRMAMQCEVLGEPGDQPDNLRSAEALLHTDVMITLYHIDGLPLYMNPAARNIAHDANAPLREFFKTQADFDLLMLGLADGGEHHQIAEVKTASGHRWFDISAKRCSDAVTGAPATLVTAIDVSELKMARDQARYLASRDQLTGCFNRSYLPQHMAHLAQSTAHQGALLYFDVDRFKQINDTYGHDVGDAVLVALSERAARHTRADDVVVRLGGDEFVIVLGNVAPGALQGRVEQLFNVLSAPTQCDFVHVNTKVSMGIAHFDPRNTDMDAALRQADVALYLAKNNGRNQFTIYSDQMGAEADRRSRTESEIEIALKRHAFELHYQPRLDVQSGRIVAVEGLARWRHPERGLVPPMNSFRSARRRA